MDFHGREHCTGLGLLYTWECVHFVKLQPWQSFGVHKLGLRAIKHVLAVKRLP